MRDLRDLTMGAVEPPDGYKIHNLNIEMDVYMDGDEEFDVQEFAQFMRMVMNEWSNDCGFYKRPKSINGVPIKEDTKLCPECRGEKWIYYSNGDRWPCERCGMAGKVFDRERILGVA